MLRIKLISVSLSLFLPFSNIWMPFLFFRGKREGSFMRMQLAFGAGYVGAAVLAGVLRVYAPAFTAVGAGLLIAVYLLNLGYTYYSESSSLSKP
jgi:hypothetical protein